MKGKFEEIRDTSTLLVLRNLENEIAIIITQFTAHTSIVCIVGNKPKGESQNGCFKETKQAKPNFPKNDISYPLIRTRTCAYQGVRNVCFSENLRCSVFLKHPF